MIGFHGVWVMAINALGMSPHGERIFLGIVNVGAKLSIVTESLTDFCGDVVSSNGATMAIQTIVFFSVKAQQPLALGSGVYFVAGQTSIFAHGAVSHGFIGVHGPSDGRLMAEGM